MKTQALLLAVAVSFAAAVHAAPNGDAAYGQAVAASAAGRLIEITPQTRFVNVTNGETVTFEQGGQRYTWHVETYSNITAFELAKVLPAEMHVEHIEVYVAPSEHYGD